MTIQEYEENLTNLQASLKENETKQNSLTEELRTLTNHMREQFDTDMQIKDVSYDLCSQISGLYLRDPESLVNRHKYTLVESCEEKLPTDFTISQEKISGNIPRGKRGTLDVNFEDDASVDKMVSAITDYKNLINGVLADRFNKALDNYMNTYIDKYNALRHKRMDLEDEKFSLEKNILECENNISRMKKIDQAEVKTTTDISSEVQNVKTYTDVIDLVQRHKSDLESMGSKFTTAVAILGTLEKRGNETCSEKQYWHIKRAYKALTGLDAIEFVSSENKVTNEVEPINSIPFMKEILAYCIKTNTHIDSDFAKNIITSVLKYEKISYKQAKFVYPTYVGALNTFFEKAYKQTSDESCNMYVTYSSDKKGSLPEVFAQAPNGDPEPLSADDIQDTLFTCKCLSVDEVLGS